MTKDHPSPDENASGGSSAVTLPSALYIVATPIGNLRDITLRALDVLRSADLIACEDTRTTRRLLSHYGINTATTAYHDHSDESRRNTLLEKVVAGGSVALVSDAGTPLVSDPGFKLVRDARDRGIRVEPVPGPSSVLAALSASGSPTDRFLFAGFPPSKSKARRDFLTGLASVQATLVFLESPKRLASSLDDMQQVFGPRRAVIARELTKLYEEFRDGPLPDLAAHYVEAGAPKGELVIIVDPSTTEDRVSPEELEDMVRVALANGASVRDAADAVSGATGQPRRKIYQLALALSKSEGSA